VNKVKILIVEDRYEKLEQLQEFFSDDNLTIETVRSVREAMSKLGSTEFDILLLDIQIPDSMGDSVSENGGIQLLEWICLSPSCKKPKRIFGLTSDSSTKSDYESFFMNKGFLLLLASVGETQWIDIIRETCSYLQIDEKEEEEFSFDICIITAMSHNELSAILELPIDWTEFRLPNDATFYKRGEIETVKGVKSIVAASSPRMGLPAAAALSTKLILKFSPDYIIMGGIAAGIKGKVNFGDILVADPCWDWGNGKLTQEDGAKVFQPAPHQLALSEDLRSKIQKVRDENKYVGDIKHKWKGIKSPNDLQLKLGPIGSGAVVLEDPETTSNIKNQNRETIGVEMEAYGVMIAASLSSNKTQPLIIKSVCDFADPAKSDDWQEYAAYTSASFIFHFIKNDLY
jgi:nucleoside phosphorylase/CheY-like chemotaxis protein